MRTLSAVLFGTALGVLIGLYLVSKEEDHGSQRDVIFSSYGSVVPDVCAVTPPVGFDYFYQHWNGQSWVTLECKN